MTYGVPGTTVPASLGRGQDAEIGQFREALDGLEQRAGESMGGLRIVARDVRATARESHYEWTSFWGHRVGDTDVINSSWELRDHFREKAKQGFIEINRAPQPANNWCCGLRRNSAPGLRDPRDRECRAAPYLTSTSRSQPISML